MKSLSRVRFFATPWTVVYQAPLSMGLSRQEYWSGLPFLLGNILIARRNINNLRYADDTTLMAESEEELKSLLMKVKVESEKVEHTENEDHGIRSHHFMGNRWGNSGNSVRLYVGGLQTHCKW